MLVPKDITVQWEETVLALAEVGSSGPWWEHEEGADPVQGGLPRKGTK